MSKFQGLLGKGKAGFKGAMAEAMPIAAVTAGVVSGQKFLDFKTMFKDKKPDDAIIKYEGEIKLAGACFALGMFGKKLPPFVRFMIMGVGVQGGIKMARKYTMDDAGKSFFEQVGSNNNFDSEINEAAKKIATFAANTSSTGVAGPDDEMNGRSTSKVLNSYSTTGVAGMGMAGDED